MYSQRGSTGDLMEQQLRPHIHPDRKQEKIKKELVCYIEGTSVSYVS